MGAGFLRSRWRAGVVVLGATLLLRSGLAEAAEVEADPQAIETARFDFTEGTAHFQAKHWAEALRSFEQSFALVPSPNTELMIARCLRELGRRTEAAKSYASAAAEARRRVTKGESKYTQTADAAETEGSAVRAQLGTIHVHVVRPAGATLMIDKKVVALSKEGDATLLHERGSASVSVSDATGAEQGQTVTVQAGATVQMDFAAQGSSSPENKPRPLPPPPPVEATRGGSSWTVPAALVSGGITLAGVGVFIGFGASSQATYDELKQRCGPNDCAPSDRAKADTGARQQTIANIGIGISAAAAVATIVFVVMALSSSDRTAARVPIGPAWRFDPSRPGPL
jgi:hypothetical protein